MRVKPACISLLLLKHQIPIQTLQFEAEKLGNSSNFGETQYILLSPVFKCILHNNSDIDAIIIEFFS